MHERLDLAFPWLLLSLTNFDLILPLPGSSLDHLSGLHSMFIVVAGHISGDCCIITMADSLLYQVCCLGHRHFQSVSVDRGYVRFGIKWIYSFTLSMGVIRISNKCLYSLSRSAFNLCTLLLYFFVIYLGLQGLEFLSDITMMSRMRQVGLFPVLGIITVRSIIRCCYVVSSISLAFVEQIEPAVFAPCSGAHDVIDLPQMSLGSAWPLQKMDSRSIMILQRVCKRRIVAPRSE